MAATANSNAQPRKPKQPTKAQLAELGARYLKIVQGDHNRPPAFTSLSMAMLDDAYMAQRPTLQHPSGRDFEACLCQLKFLAAAVFEHDVDAPYTDEESAGGKILFDRVIAELTEYGDSVQCILARVPAEAIPPEASASGNDQAEG